MVSIPEKDKIRALLVRAVNEEVVSKGLCRVVHLAPTLCKKYSDLFQPRNYVGYPRLVDAFREFSNYFLIYYHNGVKTDCCVKIIDNGDNEEINCSNLKESDLHIDITPNEIIASISDDQIIDLILRCDMSEDLRRPDSCKTILINRMERLKAEDKMIKRGALMVCHSGFYSKNGMYPILLVAKREGSGNLKVDFYNRQDKDGRALVNKIGNLEPEPPSFSEDPFESSLDIIPEYGHILEERHERLPEVLIDNLRFLPDHNSEILQLSDKQIIEKYGNYFLRQLMGSIKFTSILLKNKTMTPAPMWYKRTNKMCWTVPLFLGINDKPDVALVLEKTITNERSFYKAHTIIPLEKAYLNARLIGKVTQDWLMAI